VRLGVGAIVSQSWLTAAIAGVARKHPTISIGVRELDWWRLAAAVPGDEFELVIGECSEAERDPDIVVERFPERRAGFYVRSGHPLDEREALTIEDLAAFPLAAPRLPSRISQFLPAKSKLGQVSKGGDHFIPMIEAAAPRSIIDLVLASDAIGMSLAPFCAEALAAGKVVELPLRPPWLCIRQGIMHARGRILSGASLAFRAAAKAAERKYFTDAAAP
jgi:DNA-binding transcriptional LysR family regulator